MVRWDMESRALFSAPGLSSLDKAGAGCLPYTRPEGERAMPIYEYKCVSCGKQFDLLRRMRQADEPVTCPSCHNGAQRVLSVFASFTTGADGSTLPVAGAGVG